MNSIPESRHHPLENRRDSREEKSPLKNKETSFKAIYNKRGKPKKELKSKLPSPFSLFNQGEKQSSLSQTSQRMISSIEETPSSLSPVSSLHPQVFDVLENMILGMNVLHANGETQTTIQLGSLTGPHSPLQDAQIIISEYSTAPKAFNIQFVGHPEAVALVLSNMSELMAAFQKERLPFKVNRMDTCFLREEHLSFKRKESLADQQQHEGST